MDFIAKKYKWGYTLWIKERYGKRQVASKLKDKNTVREFIRTYDIEWL